MSWVSILKSQEVLPTRTYELALILTEESKFKELLSNVEATNDLNISGVKTVKSLRNKNDFVRNQFVKIYSQQEGTNIEKMWERMQVLLEAIEPKSQKRENLRDKIISARKNPKKYKNFIKDLKENPLSADAITQLRSAKAKEAYRKIMGKKTSGYVMRFKFRAGEGVSKIQFNDALDSIVLSGREPIAGEDGFTYKVEREGDSLVFNTSSANEVRQILMPERKKYDNFLKIFYEKSPQDEEIALPKTKVSESMSTSLLTDKKYTPKTNLIPEDFIKYLEVLGQSAVAPAKYLPLSRGAGKGIAEEVYLSPRRSVILSPYGDLLLRTDFGEDWHDDFFGNVKLTSAFSKDNAKQAIVTDILEILRRTPEAQRSDAKLYGTISLAPFANIDFDKKSKKKTATQTARDAILKIISGSQILTTTVQRQISEKQRNLIGQMQEDNTLLTISEAKIAQKQLGGEISYYDSAKRELEDRRLIDSMGIYARLKVNDKLIAREDIPTESLSQTSISSIQQIQELLEAPDDLLTEIVYGLIEKGRVQNVLSSARKGTFNRLERTSIENGMVFLLEMAEQYDDSTLREALEVAAKLESEVDRRTRREMESKLESIDDKMPNILRKYKKGMLEALSVKLADIGQNYEKYIGQNSQKIETVISNLVDVGLLEAET